MRTEEMRLETNTCSSGPVAPMSAHTFVHNIQTEELFSLRIMTKGWPDIVKVSLKWRLISEVLFLMVLLIRAFISNDFYFLEEITYSKGLSISDITFFKGEGCQTKSDQESGIWKNAI